MQTKPMNILIMGAGYAGVMAAVRLAGKTKRIQPTITLISAGERFVERPRLHEKATGTKIREKPISAMVSGTGVAFLQGWVAQINPSSREVLILNESGEQVLSYDFLVLALGSQVDCRQVPRVDKYAYTLDPFGVHSTDGRKARLDELSGHGFQAIAVGGGATGIEAAAPIKGIFPKSTVKLMTRGAAGAFKGKGIQIQILEALQDQSIELFENTPVLAVEADGVLTGSGKITADIVVWAAGFRASPLAKEAGIKTNSQDQVLVDAYLRSPSHPEVFAVGDAASPIEEPGAPWRMSLFTALVSGAQAADNITTALQGKTPRPLSYAWYGQAIALGPSDAVGFSTFPADRPWRLIFRHMPAVRLRSFFVWYLGAALEIERRIPGAFFWNGRKRYAKMKTSQLEAQPLKMERTDP